jgi:hypothetical protein
MTRGKIGQALLGCGLTGLLAAMAAPAAAATNLNGALLEKLTSSGFVATWAPQPNIGAYDTSSPQYPQGWVAQGVATISATNAWAVGSYLDRKGTGHAGTEHFDGSWHNIANPAAPAGSSLGGVTARSNTDVWAVGTQTVTLSGQRSTRTLVEHWSGTAWSVVPSPDIGQGYSDGLQSVAATGPNDVWAVGSYVVLGSGAQPLILFEHWNGAAWSITLPSPRVPVGASNPIGALSLTLLSISADAPNDAWAATGGGGPNSVMHWNGSSWTPVPGVFPNGYEINGVWAASSQDVWAVGDSLQPMNMPTLFEHWDGAAWHAVQGPAPGYTRVGLYAVSGSSSSNVYVVGAVATQSYPATHTFAEHWNGTAWSIVHAQNPKTVQPGPNNSLIDYLTAVSAASGAVFASGVQGPDIGG